jgi:hypothetical protein
MESWFLIIEQYTVVQSETAEPQSPSKTAKKNLLAVFGVLVVHFADG